MVICIDLVILERISGHLTWQSTWAVDLVYTATGFHWRQENSWCMACSEWPLCVCCVELRQFLRESNSCHPGFTFYLQIQWCLWLTEQTRRPWQWAIAQSLYGRANIDVSWLPRRSRPVSLHSLGRSPVAPSGWRHQDSPGKSTLVSMLL